MKKSAFLLAIAVLATSVTGCGCFRRVTSIFNRGAYCGPSAVASPTFGSPAPVIMPAPAPVIVPQASCDPCCMPCEPCCDPCCDPCLGGGYTPTSYPVGGDCCCGGMSGTIGTVPSGVIDPGPIPAGP